jgi:glycine oxidase
MTETSDVAVVGGGIIGTAVAWACARRGHSVTVLDPDPRRGAWRAAAGMLAPVTELTWTESDHLTLHVAAARRYPSFLTEIAEDTTLDTGYRESGTLAVAWDTADLAALRDLHALMRRLGVAAELLTGADLRAAEPSLVPGLPGGLLAGDDHQVDPRRLHAALVAAGAAHGVQRRAAAARVVSVGGDRVDRIELGDGSSVTAGVVVLAAGSWSAEAADGALPALPVRPVKGQTVRLRVRGTSLRRVVRGTVAGSPVYVVPRSDGQVIVGASVEEAGFDTAARAGAVYELLRDAQTLLPELGEADLEEVCVGLRPGSPDNAPLVGRSEIDGLVVATGHYRNGVLLAPTTADAVADVVDGKPVSGVLAPFDPNRFARAAGFEENAP